MAWASLLTPMLYATPLQKVVTLEQLQRGHIAALASMSADQRGQYTRIFGDPLDWVRRRLGHRSVLTTTVYLHALAELEMETRVALVPDF
jgi:integrase